MLWLCNLHFLQYFSNIVVVIFFFWWKKTEHPEIKHLADLSPSHRQTFFFFITRQGKKNNLNILEKKSVFFNGRKQKEKTRAEYTEINLQLTWHQVTDEHFFMTRQERKKQSE